MGEIYKDLKGKKKIKSNLKKKGSKSRLPSIRIFLFDLCDILLELVEFK